MLEIIWALIAIIMIDIVLAGDNALVIAMAANRLSPELRNRAIFWGTFGAVAIRFVSVLLLTYLLLIPGLRLIGGLALIYIGWKLAFNDNKHVISLKDTFWSAIGTIVVADAVMGIDNALGIAAAAGGNFWLVILGLLVSIPIVLYGSKFIVKILDRYPDCVFVGSFVLFVVAWQMIMREPLLVNWWSDMADWAEKLLPWMIAVVLTAKQYYRSRIKGEKQ
jgi:YjbE family integral membrane protein